MSHSPARRVAHVFWFTELAEKFVAAIEVAGISAGELLHAGDEVGG